MNNYELIWILAGNAPREVIDASIEKVNDLINSFSGKVEESYFWDQRTLAYPIEKHEVGNYCISKFSLIGDKVHEISETLRVDSSILRYLISKREERKAS